MGDFNYITSRRGEEGATQAVVRGSLCVIHSTATEFRAEITAWLNYANFLRRK